MVNNVGVNINIPWIDLDIKNTCRHFEDVFPHEFGSILVQKHTYQLHGQETSGVSPVNSSGRQSTGWFKGVLAQANVVV